MSRIDPADWLKDTFARALRLVDLMRFPTAGYDALSPDEKDRLRQTQVEAGEIVRILGYQSEFTLTMRFDRTLGWVSKSALEAMPGRKGFAPLPGPTTTPEAFLNSWKGTPYVWGGSSRQGIDCSGFTQRYFLEVRGLVIPKNSKDQRKAGRPKDAPSDDDLIFCHHRTKGAGIHHVALFFDHAVWHARLEHGVVRQTWEEFVAIYEIEEVVSLT